MCCKTEWEIILYNDLKNGKVCKSYVISLTFFLLLSVCLPNERNAPVRRRCCLECKIKCCGTFVSIQRCTHNKFYILTHILLTTTMSEFRSVICTLFSVYIGNLVQSLEKFKFFNSFILDVMHWPKYRFNLIFFSLIRFLNCFQLKIVRNFDWD